MGKSLRLHPKAQGSKPAGAPLGLRRRRGGSKSLRCNCWRHLAEKCGTMWSSRNRMLMDTDGDDVAFLSGSGIADDNFVDEHFLKSFSRKWPFTHTCYVGSVGSV